MDLLTLTARIQLPSSEVVYCESSRNYTFIHLRCGKRILLSKTLGCIALGLPKGSFIRLSRSHIVNLNYLNSIVERDENYYARIAGGTRLPISRRRLKYVTSQC
ncbi:LytR/AlgR family response regulator transcription factor [Persicitalea jodogahamensis]|uniref:HTH LytTR-type domain-containing protein n=1 Tax=Persicitalea jodogahamensis TaxID=402147 RepID=A0A8J3DG87_9BACT|nr:LytTR family DNA-binding domain-containing protein [Persicitalea jodogahamensis]GHB88914.1 hypothetical protein GCM10007390_51290 [Persicitalea jodogahamensis]